MADRVIWARNRETGETGMVRSHTVEQHPDTYRRVDQPAPDAPAADGGPTYAIYDDNIEE